MKRVPASPAARRAAKAQKIDISKVRGTGDYGAVLTRDVLGYNKPGVKITAVAASMAAYYGISAESIDAVGGKIRKADIKRRAGGSGPGSEWQEIPMTGIRNVIAETMLNSMRTQPQYTMCSELDTTEVFVFLDRTKNENSGYAAAGPTFTEVMVKICAEALMRHPVINSSLSDGRIRRYKTAHIGIAVALEDGLIVPVIRNAEKLSLPAVSDTCRTLISKARDGSLVKQDYTGSSFSISNLGNYPVDFSTPILNTPEGGILGISRTSRKPVVFNNEIVIRTMTGFSLTLDHRIIDGIEGAKFLKTLEELLADPRSVLADK